MIGQTLLFLGLHLLGLAVCLGFGPARKPHLAAALAFTIGLAVMVGLEILLLVAGVRFGPLSGSVAGLLIAAGSLLRARRRAWPDARAGRILGVWTLGFALVAALLSSADLAIMTYDSHFLVMLGGIIGQDGAFVPGLLEKMGLYGGFQALAQGLVGFTHRTFLYALAPVFAASTVALFAVVLDLALGAGGAPVRRRGVLVALVTAATFSVYMLFRHGFYIHTNFGTATYLLIFCALAWLAEVEDDPSYLPLAFLALFALALHRIEAPLVCALFLVLTVLPSRLPARRVLLPFALYTLASAGWYLVLGRSVPATSMFLTPVRCYAFAALTLALFAYYALSSWPPAARWLRPLNRRAPILAGAAIALLLVAAFVVRPEHMGKSAGAWLSTLWLEPYWEGAWLAIAGLGVLGLWAPAPPARWAFVVGVPGYMGLILLLVWSRSPYYVNIGDSASRMAIHLVPLAFFYLALKFVPLLELGGAHDHAPGEPAQPGHAGEAVVE
jgi:hypothetical protein